MAYQPNRTTLKRLGFSFEADSAYSFKDKKDVDEWRLDLNNEYYISYIPTSGSEKGWAICTTITDYLIDLSINSQSDLEHLLQVLGMKNKKSVALK